MIGTNKTYVINFNNLTESNAEIVGRDAIELVGLYNSGLNIPSSFVLTTVAFEDFLTSANLIERITAALSEIDPEDDASISTGAKSIKEMILQADFPSIVLNPLVVAYKSLSGFSDKYVNVRPSWTVSSEAVPSNHLQFTHSNVKGEAALLYAVKHVWASLFSAEAIKSRIECDYQGGLTMPVVIQRMVQSEISGRAYSIDPITNNDEYLVIQSVLGVIDPDSDFESLADYYKVDNSENKILEKNISAQKTMLLRKGRAKPGEEPHMQVEISKEWQRRQKLPDKSILELSAILKQLSKHLDRPVEIEWGYETGQIYILAASEIRTNATKPETLQEQADRILNNEEEIEIIVPEIESPGSAPEEAELPDMAELAAEVTELASTTDIKAASTPVLPEELKEKLNEPEPEPSVTVSPVPEIDEQMPQAEPIKNEFGLITNVLLNISKMDSEGLSNARRFDGAYFDGTQMLFRHRVLPEELKTNKQKLTNLINSFAIEIATAAKSVEPNPLYYSFSDIGPKEIRELSSEAETALSGSERFVLKPEAIIPEVIAIKKARKQYDARNIKLILPRLRSVKELLDVKKILTSQGIRRSSILELFAEVSVGSLVFDLPEMKQNDLDGLFIDIKELGRSIFDRNNLITRDNQVLLNALNMVLQNETTGKMKRVLRGPAEPKFIGEAVEMGISSIVFDQIPSEDLLKTIKGHEKEIEKSSTRRGRKVKPLK